MTTSSFKTAVPWKVPFTCSLYAPSGGGKTHFIYNLLKHSAYVFEKDIEECLFCYSTYQQLFEEISEKIPNVTFHQGVPTLEQLKSFTRGNKHRLLILDDLQQDFTSNPLSEKLYVELSHHFYLSVLSSCHNLYRHGKFQRMITINTQMFVLFNSPLNSSSLIHLAKQIYPHNPQILLQAYRDATSTKYGYLIIDVHPQITHSKTRLRTRIFPSEDTILYVGKHTT
jgi:hypothetical protein